MSRLHAAKEGRVSETLEVFTTGIKYLGVWMLLGAGVAGAGDAFDNAGTYQFPTDTQGFVYSYDKAINVAESHLATNNSDLVRHDTDRLHLLENVGSACTNYMARYTYGGELQNQSEDSAVSDLVSDPAHACGTVPSDVRQNLVRWRGAIQGIYDTKKSSEGFSSVLAQVKKDKADDDQSDKRIPGGAIGGVIGAIQGSGRIATKRHRRRLRNGVID